MSTFFKSSDLKKKAFTKIKERIKNLREFRDTFTEPSPIADSLDEKTKLLQPYEKYKGSNITEAINTADQYIKQGKLILAEAPNAPEYQKWLKETKKLGDKLERLLLDNIDEVLKSGGKIEEMRQNSDALSHASHAFRTDAERLNRCCRPCTIL